MNKLLVGLGIAIMATALWVGAASAQAKPEFRLGFKALADRIPDVVGEPLEEERWGANGDSLQRTTKGLMVWRKADNWTAFTNGSRTWINGPYGVAERGNGERFGWERESAAPTATPTPVPTARPMASPTPTPAPRFYDPDVKAMDPEAGGPGVRIKALMAELNEEWARLWGWRPRRPTTIYLYTDGNHLASALTSIAGWELTPEEREQYARTISAVLIDDVTTGGWGALVNISWDEGSPDWEARIQADLVYQYAITMMYEVAGDLEPSWFTQGIAYVCAYSKVPSHPNTSKGIPWLRDPQHKDMLPTVMRLHRDWEGFSSASADHHAVANLYSYMAVRVLADKVGGAPLLGILKRTASGENFEPVLKEVTGFTLEQLDGEVRARLQ